MKFGVIGEVEAAGDPARLDRLAGAEAQGYQAVWIAVREGVPASAGRSLFAAARIAERTRSVRIGLHSPLPEDLHPLRLAEDLAVLDIVSGGRLDWAPSRGACPEALEIVLRAWRGESFAHRGARYAFPELRCWPRPEQRPHPALWLAPGSAPPAAANPERIGALAQAGPEARGTEAGAREPGRPLALICPLADAGPAGAEAWLDALPEWQARLQPEWVLVWPQPGSADEAGAAASQRRFVEGALRLSV
jgi:alkanesulfonate monooxygenase SsuD/methylene tetrahydromethanopterin reductase-like flavin-dependent oxidoreductase (luciferase family)